MTRDERKLVKRLKAREEKAFRTLVETHQDQVFNVVYRLLGNREEARDITQEVFVTVFRAIDCFRGDSKLSTWLYRIAANHAKNRLKYLGRRASGRKDSLDDVSERELYAAQPQAVPSPDRALWHREFEQMLQEGLSKLSEDYRLVVVLRDIEQLSYEEIAEITGLATGTVKSRLHRARAALQKHLVRLNRRGSFKG